MRRKAFAVRRLFVVNICICIYNYIITQARENCMSSLVADESATFEHMF